MISDVVYHAACDQWGLTVLLHMPLFLCGYLSLENSSFILFSKPLLQYCTAVIETVSFIHVLKQTAAGPADNSNLIYSRLLNDHI